VRFDSLALQPRRRTEREAGEHVTFYTQHGRVRAHRELIEGLRARTATLHVKLLPDGHCPLLCRARPRAVRASSLLQGSFAPRTSLGNQLRAWRLPAALAAALALLFIGSQAATWCSRAVPKSARRTDCRGFAQALPGQPVVDVRAQMQVHSVGRALPAPACYR